MGTIILAVCFVAARTMHKSNGAPEAAQATEHSGYPDSPLLPSAQKELRFIREAGLRRDHSKLPTMVATLQNLHDQRRVRTTMHALSRLGNPAALPAIESFAQQNPGWVGEAKVARARLVAEASVGNITDNTSTVGAKVDRYYQELGLLPSDLNAGVARYRRDRSDRTDSYTSPPMEVYAMRELADMIYRGPSEGVAGLPALTQVDFSRDYASDLKMRLAQLSEEQRLVWLINDLAHKKVMRPDDDYELQLASDGGILASRLAIAKLWEMDKHRDEYNSTGFSALFAVLYSIPNREQGEVITHFRQDRDPWIRHYATWSPPQDQFVYDY